jgi:hypothetical protein
MPTRRRDIPVGAEGERRGRAASRSKSWPASSTSPDVPSIARKKEVPYAESSLLPWSGRSGAALGRYGLAWLGVFVGVAGLALGAACVVVTGLDHLEEVDGSVGSAPEAGPRDAAKLHDAASLDGKDTGGDVSTTCRACGGPASPSCCDGVCVDLASDPAHCGTCSNACTTGLCGTSLEGWASAPWRVNGSATIGAGQFGAMTGILTNADVNLAGNILYANPVVVDSFTATFSFYIGGGVDDVDAGILVGADGLAFVFETNGPTALGMLGSCFGVCGLDGFGVELDTFDNEGCGDTNANHVAVDSLTLCTTPGGDITPTTLTSNLDLPFELGDGMEHTVIVQLAEGALSVTLDGTLTIEPFALPGFVPGTSYYFGFGGGTGGEVNFHEIAPDLLITFPTPRCL